MQDKLKHMIFLQEQNCFLKALPVGVFCQIEGIRGIVGGNSGKTGNWTGNEPTGANMVSLRQ